MILGILGGLAGLAGAIFALLVGGLGAAFEAEGAQTVIGLAGAALALAKPTLAGILMLVSGIAGFIAISMGDMIGGPLLILGGILALIGRGGRAKQKQEETSRHRRPTRAPPRLSR